ncbi:MAG TPA: DUF6298 domain-containing protein [archaeon]|nr:DUF6298 domain-containing protein [archaeon]
MINLSHAIMKNISLVLALFFVCCTFEVQKLDTSPNPLRVHPSNPRYFTDNSGKAIYLTGSHTWSNLQEISENKYTEPFDFEAYLDFLKRYNHNFMRLWSWEHAAWACWADDSVKVLFGPPHPYCRTGPGLALDSLPKFDLERFNQVYFDRLRARIAAAKERGVYVMVMMFQGWSIQRKGNPADTTQGNPWWGHPYNRENNINGIDGDLNRNGEGEETHALAIPEITELQKAYIRKVVDTVNDLDNVLYEISNESHKESTEWHYAMINYIHEYEKTKAQQHPVVMTFQYSDGKNESLFASPAEAVSPNPGEGQLYRTDPPAADGSKVILSDTDHLWGIGGNAGWVWKSFLRGLNPVFMDPMEPLYRYPSLLDKRPVDPRWEAIRKNMGYALTFARKINLAEMTPHNELASTGYCLASLEPNRAEYLVYLPAGGSVTVDLSSTEGPLVVEWFDPGFGAATDIWTENGGAEKTFTAPFSGHAVLYIHVQNE